MSSRWSSRALLFLAVLGLAPALALATPFGGQNLHAMNVAMVHGTTTTFPGIFSEIAGWGCDSIRLVLQADPNRTGPTGKFQHDMLFKWVNSSGVPYSPAIAGSYDNGDRLIIDTTGWTKLMTVLHQAKTAGLKVVIDVHSIPGTTNYELWSCSDPFTITNTNVPLAAADAKGQYFQSEYRLFWTTLIGTYLCQTANQDLVGTLVGYDLMNEPSIVYDNPTYATTWTSEMTGGTWSTPSVWLGTSNHNLNYHLLMTNVVSDIRSAEATLSTAVGSTICNTAIVEGWGEHGAPDNFGWLEPVSDGGNNLIYSFHMYQPGYFANETSATYFYPSVHSLGDPRDFSASDLDASMSAPVTFLSVNSLSSSAIWVGEFATNYGSDMMGSDTWAWDCLDYFISKGWTSAWWSYETRNPRLDYTNTLVTSTRRLVTLKAMWAYLNGTGSYPIRPTYTHP